MTLLLREAIGDSLRRTRTSQSRTLREVSTSAQVSLGYLSEVERGRKEASSELLAAICGALEVPIAEVLFDVSATMSVSSGMDIAVNTNAIADPRAGLEASDGPRVVIPQPKVGVFAA